MGTGRHSAGVILIMKVRPVMDLQLTGPSGIRILHPGIVMLKNLPAFPEIKMDWTVLPDGEFLPPLELSCVENYFKDFVAKNYKDRHVIYARCAHLTEPKQIHLDQGRGQCQNRNLCQRGCPFGGYFAANSTTIPWAMKTGNMTLRPFSVVHSIIYDEKKGKATGVRVIDAHTKEVIEYYARIIFVNAAAINTNLILLEFQIKPFSQWTGK